MDQVWGERSPFMNVLSFDPCNSQRLEVWCASPSTDKETKLYTDDQKKKRADSGSTTN